MMRILAIHPGALGDVILFGQLLAALREEQAGLVRLVASGQKAALLKGLGAVDEAADYNSLPMHEVFSELPISHCCLPAMLGPCDLLVSCLGGGDAAAEARLAELASARQAVLLPVRPEADWQGHLVELWAAKLRLAEAPLPQTVPLPHWSAPEAWRRQAVEELSRVGLANRPYVLLHPGAGAREKCWPLQRFVELAGELDRSHLAGLFVAGPTELDWWPADELGRLGRQRPAILNPPLATLAGLLASARIFVGHDSGPTHLSAALGTPTLAIFGPTNPVHFAPRGSSVRLLHGPLEKLEVASVLAAVRELRH